MPTLRPTFSESWYRVADLKIKLRASAQISRQHYRGDRWYVVRDPAGNQFHRLSAPAYRFVGLLDGSRTVSEAWELVGGQLADDAPTQNEVIQILSQLHAANLVEANVTPDAQVLLKRHKRFQQQRWQNRFMNVLFPRIPLWDPDTFLLRWMPVMRIFLSKFGAILWLIVVGSAVAALAPEWPKLASAASDAIDPGNWPFLWATFVIIKLIHELGHGFTCRRYGGECHELGVMFLVLVPAPYVDASTAWSFPSRWARMFVGAGGMIFELFVASIMAFVWLYTAPGLLIHQLAYNAMLIASVSTVIFNANPLLRYDGYYILSDWLEIPNLSYRAREYSLGLIKRHLFTVKLPQPLPPFGQRMWLMVYALTSGAYRIFVGVMIIVLVWDKVPVLGVLMALGGVVTWAVVPVVTIGKYLMIDPELHRKRGRAALWVGAATAATVIGIGVLKFPFHYYAFGVIEPADKQMVIAGASGTVQQVIAHDGQSLKKGDVILICRNEQAEKELASYQAQREAMRAEKQVAYRDPSKQEQIDYSIRAVSEQIDRLSMELAKLTLVSPRDGQLVLPDMQHLPGRFIHEGEELGMIAPPGDLRVSMFVDQDDAALPYMQSGTGAEVRPAGDPGVVLKGKLEGRSPTPRTDVPPQVTAQSGGPVPAEPSPSNPKQLVAQRPQTEIWLTLANPGGKWISGQTAQVRFNLDKKPLIWNWSRRIWQLVQSHSHSRWM